MERMTEPTGRSDVERDVDALLAADEQRETTVPHAKRDTLDLREQEIKDAVLRMGALVEDAIRRAARSLVDHDAELALDIVKADARINDAQREVSRLISVAIATQNPVARDLRYLLTLDHVTYELERMGDHAASVAKQVIKLAPEPPLAEYVKLPEMAELAHSWCTASCGRWSMPTPWQHAKPPSPMTRSTCSTTRPSTKSWS